MKLFGTIESDNDITTKKYVDDNRGYTREENTTELTSETITTEPEGDYGWGALTYGDAISADQLLVVCDGVSYVVNRSDDGQYYYYYGAPTDGTDFSEYPFGIQSDMLGDDNSIATENSGTFDITINTYSTSIHTTEDFEEAVRSVSGSGAEATSATLTVSGWTNNAQTVSVSGVTSNNHVIVSPDAASTADYISTGIYCSAQGTDTLTFTCTDVPTSAITVNVLIL